MCQKGLKGREYFKIANWFKAILQNSNKLVDLLEDENKDPKAVTQTLNVIKSGLLSEDAQVANICARCINKIVTIIAERAQYQLTEREADEAPSANLQVQIWEWFTQGNNFEGVKANRSQSPKKNQKPSSVPKRTLREQKKIKELESLLNESGIKAFLKA